MAITTFGVSTQRPLGLLPEFKVTNEIEEKLTLIEQYDMARQRNALLDNLPRLISDEAISAHEVDLLEVELKKFLSLPLLFPEATFPFVPSGKVDAIWHKFILDTKLYRQFCDNVFGAYIDHTPEDTLAKTISVNKSVYFYTKRCLTEAYGGFVPSVWGASASCDTIHCTA